MADVTLEVVDGLALSEEERRILRPGALMRDRGGRLRRLPRWFYRIDSWEQALEAPLSPHFEAWEFINVDVREAERLRNEWPRYIPCAVTLLAAHLELLREAVDTYVHISANGGYRSPEHALSRHASTHCWGTAANLYRVGDDWLDDERTIGRYTKLVRKLMPGAWVRPFGRGVGQADDHLHLDLGFTVMVPGHVGGEDEEDESLPGGGTDVTETAEAGAR
jgi:hypothetical protein